MRYSHHRPWLLRSELWTGFTTPSYWRSFDSRRDTLTPAQRGRGLINQRGWRNACSLKCLCLLHEHVSEFVLRSCFSLAGLCSPLEKRLLRLRAHPSTWILLHHSSHSPGRDEAAHPLLWRYSQRTHLNPYQPLTLGRCRHWERSNALLVMGLVQWLPTLSAS